MLDQKMIAGEQRQDRADESPQPVAAADRPKRPATRRRGHPAWLRAADACQRSLRQPLPVAADSCIAAAAVYGSTGSARCAALAGAALVAGGFPAGVWKHRSPVQAQGAGWYLRRVAPCAVLIASVMLLAGVAERAAVIAGAGAFVALGAAKVLLWITVAAARRRGMGLERALVIGPEREVAGAEYRIHLYPEAGLVCAHSQICPPADRASADESLRLVEALVGDHSVTHVVCAGSHPITRNIVRLLPPSVDVSVVEPLPGAGAPSTRIGDLGVICLSRPSWGSALAKRAFDVVAASLLLVALSPLLILTAVAIRLGDPGPAVFRQRRTGLRNRMFTMYKFRSMVLGAERMQVELLDRNIADGLLFKAVDDPRITRVGAFIRRFSIDELPQLVNVIKGEMSLVGPRPLPCEFDESDLFAGVRHRVLPGITGLWQIKGANALSYEDMIDLDCAYVGTYGLGLDLRILLQTIPAVLVRRDPY